MGVPEVDPREKVESDGRAAADKRTPVSIDALIKRINRKKENTWTT